MLEKIQDDLDKNPKKPLIFALAGNDYVNQGKPIVCPCPFCMSHLNFLAANRPVIFITRNRINPLALFEIPNIQQKLKARIENGNYIHLSEDSPRHQKIYDLAKKSQTIRALAIAKIFILKPNPLLLLELLYLV